MLFRVFSFLLLALPLAISLGACSETSFSNSSSDSPSGSEVDSSADALGAAGTLPNGSGSSAFVADGRYYALLYKTACADFKPIAIILVSNSASQAVMTRQNCIDLSAPVAINPQNVLGMDNGLITHDGLIYVRDSN